MWLGSHASTQVADLDFPTDSRTGSQAQQSLPPPPPVGVPDPQEAPRGLDPGAQLMAAYRHTDSCPWGAGSRRRSAGGTCNASIQRARPWEPPPPGPRPIPAPPRWASPPRSAGRSSTRGWRRKPGRTPQRRRDPPRGVLPHGTPGRTDGNRPGTVTRGRAGRYTGFPAPRDWPHGNGLASTEGQARPQSQPNDPRSWSRTPASTHPSGMRFCPMPRCARREGASPT